MKHSNVSRLVGFGMVAVGTADLIMGTTQTPLPVLGDYLNQQIDALLIAGGVVLIMFF